MSSVRSNRREIAKNSEEISFEQQNQFVLLLGFPADQGLQLRSELTADRIDVHAVGDINHFHDYLTNPRCGFVILCDQGFNNALGIVNAGRRASKAKWIVFSQDQSISYRTRAIVDCGVELVIEYPVLASKVSGRLRRLITSERLIAKKTQISKLDVPPRRLINVADNAPLIAIPSAGIHSLSAARDFRDRRKNWPELLGKPVAELGSTTQDLSAVFQETLKKLISDIGNEGRISFVSFGVDSAFIGNPPDSFIVLSSTDTIPLSPSAIPARKYPEIMKSFTENRAVMGSDITQSTDFKWVAKSISAVGANSVAIIPLRQGAKIFGVLKLRFPTHLSPVVQEFLADLAAYAEEMTALAAHLDFFARIYRNAK